MLKTIRIKHSELENHLYPNLYRFKKKIKEFSARDDITSFSLGDKGVIKVLTDGEHAGQVFVESGAKFIKNSAVKRYVISEYDGFYITHEKNNLLQRSQLELHDVLFTTIGKYLGVSAVVNESLVGANINQNVVRLRIDNSLVSPQYLSLYLNSKVARYQIDTLFTGNTHPILTYPKIKSLKVFIKDKTIHDEITTNIILAEKYALDGLKNIDKAREELVKSLDIDFTKIPNKLNYRIKQSDIKNNDIITPEYYRPLYVNTIEAIKEKHDWKTLGSVASFKSGDEVGSGNYKLYLDKQENDVSFIRTTDILNYEVDRYPDFYVENEIYQNLDQAIEPNEILFSKDGKIGLVALTTKSDKCIVGSGILRIIADTNKIDPYYLFTALSVKQIGLYQAKQRTVIASTLPHLRMDRISDFIIPLVPNQDNIINLAKKGFELKEKSKQLIDKSRKLLDDSLEL
ncbi:restriction endonuclease subunit S [Terrilactibacillus laevilacticus]|uniref:Restriction endonuclease subunit S n=1 Tax=Terrilactibacillus laevilacticus TaxID=1380157 RepID=A0ABW5PNU7_9BACI|nr:restriction endonuclease subunit S [Terrilactibacillus laevilacticus]